MRAKVAAVSRSVATIPPCAVCPVSAWASRSSSWVWRATPRGAFSISRASHRWTGLSAHSAFKSASSIPYPIGNDHNLAEGPALLDHCFGLSNTGQGKDAVDHRTDLTAAYQLHDRKEIVAGPAVRPEDRQLTGPHIPQVRRGLVSGGSPAGDQAPAVPRTAN